MSVFSYNCFCALGDTISYCFLPAMSNYEQIYMYICIEPTKTCAQIIVAIFFFDDSRF